MTAGHGVKSMKPVRESAKRRREIAKRIRAAAERARAEAEARRRQAAKHPAAPPPAEIGGPKGPEPTRYGDWEKKGLISDF
jgi:hypothetical protein